jgi:hypothetical protein
MNAKCLAYIQPEYAEHSSPYHVTSSILETEKNIIFWKQGLFPSSDEGWVTPILLDPLEIPNLNPSSE